MKNIHVLPTDKHSKLVLNNQKELWFNPDFSCKSGLAHPQNIYITSDEEIKEGNWYAYFIFDEKTKWTTTKLDCVVKANLNKTNEYLVEPFSKYCKKIILTTDQDLIADGVQAIDDKFLEWFVKNPTCESVRVIHKFDEDWSEESGAFEIDYYKIIIPQEEPKCLTKLEIAKNIAAIGIGKKETKQETLEEAAENYSKLYYASREPYLKEQYAAKLGFKDGAKWQAERGYTELLEWLASKNYLSDNVDVIRKEFEQHKKK